MLSFSHFHVLRPFFVKWPTAQNIDIFFKIVIFVKHQTKLYTRQTNYIHYILLLQKKGPNLAPFIQIVGDCKSEQHSGFLFGLMCLSLDEAIPSRKCSIKALLNVEIWLTNFFLHFFLELDPLWWMLAGCRCMYAIFILSFKDIYVYCKKKCIVAF